MNKCPSCRSPMLCELHCCWSFNYHATYLQHISFQHHLPILSTNNLSPSGQRHLLQWAANSGKCSSTFLVFPCTDTLENFSTITHALSCNMTAVGTSACIMWPEMVGSVFRGLRLPTKSVMLFRAIYLFISHMPYPPTANPLHNAFSFCYRPFPIHSICSCLAQVGIFELQ